ncbi:ParB/RepB/Spo0J family partition protein [Psychromicrobium sp. YIM B11713]|uniref:ParB/RepB/Spo0J family partition protein n=1 Tax=Psychromicrobium sp. YIM B11713 TaxID=3145233 RepID=UPI00374FA341
MAEKRPVSDKQRRGLGRGLGALIPSSDVSRETEPNTSRPVDLFFPEGAAKKAPTQKVSRETPELVEVPGASFAQLDLTSIQPNHKQPRSVFDEDDMAELVHSIREIGVLQPIVVRKNTEPGGELYELVMGERRWRASQAAGMQTIPAIIRETSDDDLLRDALLENLHRSQLNPLEEAAAYQQLLEDFGTTHEELADRIGRSRPQVSNTLRLLKLPAAVQRRVAAGVLSAGHARALLSLPDSEAMEKLAQRIVAEGMSVRATEEAVALWQGSAGKRPASERATARHERLDFLASSLADRLDTNVKISLGARKGKVSIEFASVEDLNRIMAVLNPED